MKIEAIQLGESLNIKKFLEKYRFKCTAKEPHVITWGNNSHIILFRYGVIVFWEIGEGEKNEFLAMIEPFVVKPLTTPLTETAQWKKGKEIEAFNGIIVSENLDPASMQLIGVSLARTVVLDFFEQKVNGLLNKFSEIIEQFTQSGRSSLSGKALLQLAGEAISINNLTTSQMAMLDKPDFTWNDTKLDELFVELEEEYEIAERHNILTKKLGILLHDSEFIMNIMEKRRSYLLELTIIFLFVIDILVILLENIIV